MVPWRTIGPTLEDYWLIGPFNLGRSVSTHSPMHDVLVTVAEIHCRMNQNGEPAAIDRLKSLKFPAQGCQVRFLTPFVRVCHMWTATQAFSRTSFAPPTGSTYVRDCQVATCATCASPCRPLLCKMTVTAAGARGGRGANVRLKLRRVCLPQSLQYKLY